MPDYAASPLSALAQRATGVLVFDSGEVVRGIGIGATGHTVAELCFNTAITGYQEILTDPSYAGQIVTFTFPHIGNTGINDEDIETGAPAVAGCVLRAPITPPSNYRASGDLDAWLRARNIIGLAGVDTRAITRRLRTRGFANAVIAHDPAGEFDLDALRAQAAAWPGLEGMDLAKDVTADTPSSWSEARWDRTTGYTINDGGARHVVAIDYGIKRNMLRELAELGCKITVVPATASAEDILTLKPDGILLSNGPGDPAATGAYAIPVIRTLIDSGVPILGICLGHQMLALALGAKTLKMRQGHHGANHPVKDLARGTVQITSMNHGFTVDGASLPEGVRETHRSLFDGTNCGLEVEGKPIFSVQYHPEASPGPQDGFVLFADFVARIDAAHAGRETA